MSTQVTSQKIMDLPILKHFSENELSTKVESWRKGEKGLYGFLKLALFGALGWATWVYILPTVFMAIGQVLAVAATGISIVLLIVAAPAILRWIRALTRAMHKVAIKYDPFAQLEVERMKMLENQKVFRVSKAKIAALKTDMEIEAKTSQEEAEKGQVKILSLQGKAENLKVNLDNMVKAQGVAAKSEDDYINGQSDLIKVLSEAERVNNKVQQSKDFVQKYGTRASIMKKMGQKLIMVETSMDIKILDFDTTIEMLKKDYAFSQKSREATDAAKSAMGFTKGWELEYALEVVTNTIAEDIAITSGNLKDIDMLTSKYSLDSDELYASLNDVADKIKIGASPVPMAKQYNNPDYKLTTADKQSARGLGDMF